MDEKQVSLDHVYMNSGSPEYSACVEVTVRQSGSLMSLLRHN